MSDTTAWSSNALSGEPIAALEAMERAVTVDLIATFEPNLVCCAVTDTIGDLVSRTTCQNYDYLPVRKNDRIVGLLPLQELRSCERFSDGQTAETAMRRLDESILIASGTGVLGYIEEAEQHPCRLVMRGTRITGIVTISDLQKLPVRPALFLLVTHLELLMAAVIRRHFRGRTDDDWLIHLGKRRECFEERYQKLKAQKLDLDRITALYFAEKRIVLLKSGLLGCSRTRAESEFGAIEKLRDSLAHASDYAATFNGAKKTVAAVKCARHWTDCFRNRPDKEGIVNVL